MRPAQHGLRTGTRASPAITADTIIQLGYFRPSQAPDGTWYAIGRFLYTVAIVEDISPSGYRSRYCFGDWVTCLGEYEEWIQRGFQGEPDHWIRHTGTHRVRIDGKIESGYP